MTGLEAPWLFIALLFFGIFGNYISSHLKPVVAASEGSSFIYCPKCRIRMNGKNYQPYMYDDDDMIVYTCSCGCKSRWDFDAPCPLLLWSSE
jgi:hypothetical protein